jgi:hypothetical protein
MRQRGPGEDIWSPDMMADSRCIRAFRFLRLVKDDYHQTKVLIIRGAVLIMTGIKSAGTGLSYA